MKKIFLDFVEGGFFTAFLFIAGAALGLALSTGFFTSTDMTGGEVLTTVIETVGFALIGVFSADWIRMRLFKKTIRQ